MTHDELLEKLNFVWDIGELQSARAEALRNALRAVVELHKPFEPLGVCSVCRNESEYFVQRLVEYPCPTIQAIEKELE